VGEELRLVYVWRFMAREGVRAIDGGSATAHRIRNVPSSELDPGTFRETDEVSRPYWRTTR